EALWAIGRLCCVNGLAILPGLYKLVPVALYQSGHARGAGEQWDHGLTLLRLILLQLIPTYGPRFLFLDSWIQINGVHPYLLWASGAFSPVRGILLARDASRLVACRCAIGKQRAVDVLGSRRSDGKRVECSVILPLLPGLFVLRYAFG